MKYFSVILFFITLKVGTAQPLLSDSLKNDNSPVSLKLFNTDSLIAHACQHLGLPYRFHGNSPATGFDCSGFVCYNFKRYNIQLPHSSFELIKHGEKIRRENAVPGDIIFFKVSNLNSTKAGHVGIVIARDGLRIKFIHASVKKGIRIDSTSTDYYRKRYLGIRRISSETVQAEK